VIATPEIGLPSRALMVSPRYDESDDEGEPPLALVGALGELPAQPDATIDAARRTNAQVRKGMPPALQAVCYGICAKSRAFPAMPRARDYKFDAGDNECEKLVTVSLCGPSLSSNGIEVE
jgi:hypothetical protein